MPDDTRFEDGRGPLVEPGVHDASDTSSGKHALLMVPDFVPAPSGGQAMTSYLRLGAAHAQAGPATSTHPLRADLGEDLAALVQGFSDDLRDRGDGTESEPAPAESASNPPGGPAGPLTTDQRRAESRLLHTKGGWRDHSDGNRITTTRGDKIEVIRGNYKMLVLGRADGFGDAASVEISGGQVDSSDPSFASGADGLAGQPPDPTRDVAALQTTFQWFQHPDGHWGWKQTVKTGNPDTPLGNNGQVITETWVDLQQDTVTAREIDSTTNAGTVTDTVNAGDVNAYVNASDTVRNGTVSHFINNTTSAALISDFTDVGLHSTVEIVGVGFTGNVFHTALEIDAGFVDISLEFALLMVDLQAAATSITTLLGTVIDTHAGLHMDTHAGVHVDNHSGAHLEVHTGLHATTHEGAQLEIAAGDVTRLLAAQEVTVRAGQVTVDGGTVIHIAAATSTS